MGIWSAGITGNDTAMDLRSEYTCAFSYYETDEALRKIDEYVRNQMCNESDPEEWCNYVYSLADFMWKKGILTEEVKSGALSLIDTGFGLDAWADAGEKALEKRKKALERFREQLLSPMPGKKKIKPNIYTEDIFENGDVVAIRLMTKNKPFASMAALTSDLSDRDFQEMDGKYILIQKIGCQVSWQSAIVPEIKDHWAVFLLFDGVYDHVPENVNVDTLRKAEIIRNNRIYSAFCCESSMFCFRKRSFQVVGHKEAYAGFDSAADSVNLFLKVSNDYWDPDSLFLGAMGRTVDIRKYDGSQEALLELAYQANGYGAYDYSLSKEENVRNRAEEEKDIRKNIEQALFRGADFYSIRYGKECGFASILDNRIDNVYINGQFQHLGLGTELVRRLSKKSGKTCFLRIPQRRNRQILTHICEKTGVHPYDKW